MDEYNPQNPEHVVISFDGVYECVWRFAIPILREFGYCFELFVIGDVLGQVNYFDEPEPLARFANIDQLREMVDAGGRVQWHTSSHAPLAGRDDHELKRELLVPDHLLKLFPAPHFQWFAYPHGEYMEAADAIIRAHYRGAVTTNEISEEDPYQFGRLLVFKETKISKDRLSLIIPNYNYGVFIGEAISSVLAQSVLPDEILIIDDASTDDSRLIIDYYAEKFPNLLRAEYNSTNLGVVDNFRKAISLTEGDFVVFIGADNRVRYDFVEQHLAALKMFPDAAVAYCDIVLFGPRARIQASRLEPREEFSVKRIFADVATGAEQYLWRFPEPSPELIANMHEVNFVHGSAAYRRDAYEGVGGYQERKGVAEDKSLFHRMLASGWRAVHVPEPLLEYRQHSLDQANQVVGREASIHALQRENARLKTKISAIEKILGS
ncbi:glycosyltransferase [Kordiimonas gwangyangensis]|uniref:glycosyltransferase n=1 Tax=Kordiimonas gwangyangensis TaxID=288022 RepID=UPI00138AEFC6|nr:glycosyltransferase [Kordiimonas gwangyangensis]